MKKQKGRRRRNNFNSNRVVLFKTRFSVVKDSFILMTIYLTSWFVSLQLALLMGFARTPFSTSHNAVNEVLMRRTTERKAMLKRRCCLAFTKTTVLASKFGKTTIALGIIFSFIIISITHTHTDTQFQIGPFSNKITLQTSFIYQSNVQLNFLFFLFLIIFFFSLSSINF